MTFFDKDTVLQDLDNHASEFDFPMLDNTYVEFAKARLSLFAGPESWVIAFEIIGYSINEGSFVNDLYAFGNCLSREGVLTSFPVAAGVADCPFVDPATEAWIADWKDWSISCRDRRFHFQPTYDEYVRLGISVDSEGGPGSLRPKDILRFFTGTKGCGDLFLAKQELLEELHGCQNVNLLLQTEEWQHPDIASGELPSESISIRSLADAVALSSADMFMPGRINTDWRLWETAASD
jgi:hypothetical protein